MALLEKKTWAKGAGPSLGLSTKTLCKQKNAIVKAHNFSLEGQCLFQLINKQLS